MKAEIESKILTLNHSISSCENMEVSTSLKNIRKDLQGLLLLDVGKIKSADAEFVNKNWNWRIEE